MMEEEQLKEMPIDIIKPNQTAIFYGKRNTGKSRLIEHLLFKNKHKFKTIIVQSSTENVNKFFQQFIPHAFIYTSDEIDFDCFERVFDRQKQIEKEKGEVTEDDSVLMILDDMLQDANALKDKRIVKAYANGRHYKVGIWICAQHLKAVPKIIRGQMDLVFALAEPNKMTRKGLYEEHFSCYPDINSFEDVFQTVTTNYGCLVMNSTIRNNDWRVCTQWTRASLVDKQTSQDDPYKWRVDCPDMYKLAELHQLPAQEWGKSKCVAVTGLGKAGAASRKGKRGSKIQVQLTNSQGESV